MAIVFELLVLLPVAWGIQLVWRGEALELPRLDGTSLGLGVLATLPLLLLLVALTWTPLRHLPAFRRIHERLEQGFGPTLSRLQSWQIVVISIAAGVGEEILFRGVLQPRITLWGAALIFGLLHSITFTYTVVATALGAYLGWVFQATENLAVPILAHALYDAIALWVFRREFRKSHPEKVLEESPDAGETDSSPPEAS